MRKKCEEKNEIDPHRELPVLLVSQATQSLESLAENLGEALKGHKKLPKEVDLELLKMIQEAIEQASKMLRGAIGIDAILIKRETKLEEDHPKKELSENIPKRRAYPVYFGQKC